MATNTTTNPIDSVPSGSQDPTVVRVLYARNMDNMTRSRLADDAEPERTASNPSPAKRSAGPRVPGQLQIRSRVDTAIEYELKDARYHSPDLAEQMFGHLVSTELARDILNQFVVDGAVRVFEGKKRLTRISLPANSAEVQSALEKAIQDAKQHGLRPVDSDGQPTQPTQPQNAKTKKKIYSWQWRSFPVEPIQEDSLVIFLNAIIDHAFAFAKSRLAGHHNELRHRFAAPRDKYHAIPLAYEVDGEDMRPDFFLLPTEAFSPDLKTVDDNYVNFTALRAVGESKNKVLPEGISQVHRYLRGIRRAQPWVHFAVAMAVAKDKVCLLRGDSSGVERVQLSLTDGRGCIELIRILLGIALADAVDLGQNPDVELQSEVRLCRLPNPPRASTKTAPSDVPVRASAPSNLGPRLTANRFNLFQSAEISNPKPSFPSATVCQSTRPVVVTTSRQSNTSKRNRSTVEHENDPPEQPPKKRRVGHVERLVFFPMKIHGHTCLGILFTVCSIRGRCTVVLTVFDPNAPSKLLVLKMSWQDEARLPEQNKVLVRLAKRKPHPNVIVPLKSFRASRNGQDCTTLGAIRGFLDDQLAGFAVENRALIVSIYELKRPVKYFWGLHDFVRGLRGALLGHEYLVSIGILHRDFSENNMVLARRPGDERGYLIDLDMAIFQGVDEATETGTDNDTDSDTDPPSDDDLVDYSKGAQVASPLKQDATKPVKGLRTGTTPYMSVNVLEGRMHTHFDDVESFLYVLLLFFFSYSGPLSKEDLRESDARGFVEPVGSGRLSHMTRWPAKYALWADGDFIRIAENKASALKRPHADLELVNSPEVQDCLGNWHPDLREPIKTLLGSAWRLFSRSLAAPGIHMLRTEVSHAQFLKVLDKWLKKNAHLEKKFSNCPFDEQDSD